MIAYRNMKITPKQFDQWRPVPRLLVLLYGWICYETLIWFTALDAPTASQAGFASTIWTAAAAWFGFYVNSRPEKHDE